MALRAKEEERQRLIAQITEWNANRLDIFELSLPNEDLEFYGVMRFFYQDAGSKVSTKCIRVASSAATRDVLATLVEKFRPDMRMLSMNPEYSLYEVHVTGEERILNDNERPLYIQLNWGKDDREGRFLLKRKEDKTVNLSMMGMQSQSQQNIEEPPPGGFKRKLSKREKKEKKKKDKEAKLREKEEKENVAEKLYNELPETSFTRSISNPEAVMRRRRQQKLEKRLQEYKSKDGGPDTGGTLKIYGESLRPDVPYKTLLLSLHDNTAYIVKVTLEKYGLEKEDPTKYCLVQVTIPPQPSTEQGELHGGWGQGFQEFVMEDDECPLILSMQQPPHKGTIYFHLRRRTADMPTKKKKKKGARDRGGEDAGYPPGYEGPPMSIPPEKLPFFMELNQDGSELYKGKRHRLPLNVTEVGAERGMSVSGQYLQLYGPDIHPRHCVVAHTEGIVTVTPTSKDAEIYVEGMRVYETTMLQHGMTVRFGKGFLFRFIDPLFEEKQMKRAGGPEAPPPVGAPPPYDSRGPPKTPNDTANFETTFDVDGHIETIQEKATMSPQGDMTRYPSGPVGPPEDILPATLEFREEGEDAFLAAIISEVNGAVVQFKLAPTYTLYMATRYRISMAYRPDMSPHERAHRLTALVNKVANMVQQTIQENRGNAGALSFWMANASELLHFYKQDGDISRFSLDAQDISAEAVQVAFRFLVNCMQTELHSVMVAFLDDTDDDREEEDEVLQVLSSAMSLLRRCRVNAALTIQLFSQLFHFINMWLFNKLVLEPRLQLCTRVWGSRLRRRLARVEIWAEKQGLELAADCHLARIIQAAHLLQAPKSSRDDITSISSTCFKLNSMQLRALLQNYVPGPGEPHIPQDLINNVVAVAENTADELTRSDGRDVRLEEEPDLQLPFLLPEDGYSCDIIRGVPSGLAEFLDPLSQTSICRMTVQQMSSGLWTIYMVSEDVENLRAMQPSGGAADGAVVPPPAGKEPEVIVVAFNKVNGSMGLSIVAAKGEGQEKRGIYIKSVVPRGAAAIDGRLEAGDQLLEVDAHNLVGLTQEKAAEFMTRTGHTVTLKVAKQGAIYHGLATLLSQPSPVLQRGVPGSPRRSQGAGTGGKSPRPKSEEVSRFNGQQDDSHMMQPPGGLYSNVQRPINQQHGARSSPALASSRSHEQLRDADPYSPYKQPPPNAMYDQQREPREALRSKSTSNLDHADVMPQEAYRQAQSTSTLPRMGQPGGPGAHPGHPGGPGSHLGPHPGPHPGMQQRLDASGRPASQPDLQHRRDDPRNYENYPHHRDERYGSQPDYVNQADLQRGLPYGHPADMRGAASTPNVREDHFRSDMGGRSKSEEMDHSRVHEWQQRNDLEQQYGAPYGGGERPDMMRPREEDVPRSQANNQQYQQGFYSNTAPRAGRDATPPFEQMRRPQDMEDMRGKPGVPSKPNLAPKPAVKPQEVPRVQVDNRQTQPNFFDPHRQGGAAHGAGPQDQYHATPAQATYSQSPGNYMPAGTPTSRYHTSVPSNTETRPTYARMEYNRDNKNSPPGRLVGRNESPDLPPPPPDVPPPELPPPPPPEEKPYGEDQLPPPPPPPNEYERQIRDEQEKMMRQMQGQPQYDRRHPGPYPGNQARPGAGPGPGPGPQYGDRYGSPSQSHSHQQPEPQRPPGYQQQAPPTSQAAYRDYQNLPPMQNQPPRSPYTPQDQRPGGDSPARPQYPYRPSHERDTPRSEPSKQGPPKPPPVAAKPRLVLPKPDFKKELSPSPWERAEKEKESKRREEELKRIRDMEIGELETKPYLSNEEQERLRKLRLDQEFQRRVEEVSSKDDEGGDSDTDITDRAAGRAKVLRMMQEEMEKKRQQLLVDRQQREAEHDQAEMDKLERQERRLQQFERERSEQKEREMRRQEKRERETEEYLRKQREREQMRDMQMAREAEERALREEARRQDEEMRRKGMMDKMADRERDMQKDADRMNRYGHLQYSDPSNRGPPPQSNNQVPDGNRYPGPPPGGDITPNSRYGAPPSSQGPPTSMYGAPPSSQAPPANMYGAPPNSQAPPTSMYGAPPGGQIPPNSMYGAPAPPQRNSSYDIANQHGYRGPNGIPNNGLDMNGGVPRSLSASALRQGEGTPGSAKKSVSFHDNLATEIRENHQFPSTSSENSHPDYQHPVTADPNYMPSSQPNYPYRGGMGQPEPSPFQRPHYGPPPTAGPAPYGAPNAPGTPNEVFAPRTPDNEPPAMLVAGPTPGVVGAQEIYRDPRDRIAAQRRLPGSGDGPIPERMSFRDKMKMFAQEAGEQNTPKDKAKISRAQRAIETTINGQ